MGQKVVERGRTVAGKVAGGGVYWLKEEWVEQEGGRCRSSGESRRRVGAMEAMWGSGGGWEEGEKRTEEEEVEQ